MPNPVRRIYRALKRAALGDSLLPRQFIIGMRDPQTEVAVWLHGLDRPCDVTSRHVMACLKPLTIGIVFEADWRVPAGDPLSLRFVEREGSQRLLGEIRLSGQGVRKEPGGLRLFGIRGSSNYCLSRAQLWAHHLHLAYTRWRARNPDRLTPREAHSIIVFFICPRPVVLVSVLGHAGGNVFPMNLMGPAGDGLFAFALSSKRHAAPIVARAGRLAISNVPLEHAQLAKSLGRNHLKDSIDMTRLPFSSRLSPTLRFPVPEFASRVRELEVQSCEKLGSHTFFLARVLNDAGFSEAPEFFYVHGIYQAWRARQRMETNYPPSAARVPAG